MEVEASLSEVKGQWILQQCNTAQQIVTCCSTTRDLPHRILNTSQDHTVRKEAQASNVATQFTQSTQGPLFYSPLVNNISDTWLETSVWFTQCCIHSASITVTSQGPLPKSRRNVVVSF